MQSTEELDGDQPAAAWSGVKHFAVRQNLETDGIHFRPFESNHGAPQKCSALLWEIAGGLIGGYNFEIRHRHTS